MITLPEQLARERLYAAGIKISRLYDEKTGKISIEEMKKIVALDVRLAINIRKTFDRLAKSENEDIKHNRNLRNTLVGSFTELIMQDAVKGEKKNAPTVIRWIPSSAKEPDAYHARFYGKTMTLKAARDLGLATRYGCQCGFEVLNNEKEIRERIK